VSIVAVSYCIRRHADDTSALSYYMPAILTTIGITNPVKVTNINLGYSFFQWAFALFGAALVERAGRRKLMLFSMSACTCVWIIMTICNATYAESGGENHAAGTAGLAFIFMFGAVYSVGITPLQALYRKWTTFEIIVGDIC
jgi:MFS family permease